MSVKVNVKSENVVQAGINYIRQGVKSSLNCYTSVTKGIKCSKD